MLLKQSTAVTVKFGPFLDSTDGNTVEDGLTIQKADVRLSKNGGDMAAANADQGVADAGAAHDEIGYYDISLDATDTNTLGRLKVMIHEAGALAVWQEYMVLPANAYDSLVAGSDYLQADVVEISGDSNSADNLELDYDGTGYAKANSTVGTVTTVGTTTTNTDMRGTDNAALASVVGALADAAAAGDPTDADTLMQYIKQLINILIGTAGIATFPAEAAPGDGVSLAEVIRAMHADVTGLNGDAMRGTDAAALAATALTDATWTDAKAAFLDAAISTRTKPADTQARVTLVDTTTTNTDMRGTDNAALAATALSTAQWTAARAGYLDNLNIGENVAGTSEISALNDLSAADVNAEVVDALATDTYAEPGQEAPGATVALSTKIGYLYKAFRNKLTQTAVQLSLYNDAGAVVDQKATVSDDGATFTRGEIGTGP